jgi:FlaG/FlaF family flagellin (archaellin)
MRYKGVSPIVAEFVLIAVTLVSAVGVAFYVKALRPPTSTPQANFEVHLYDNLDTSLFLRDYTYNGINIPNYNWYYNDNDFMKIKHVGGDPLQLSDLDITLRWAGGPSSTVSIFIKKGIQLSDPDRTHENLTVWSPGTELWIRLITDWGQPENTARYYGISPGDIYEVCVVYRPAQTTIYRALVTGERVYYP